MGRNGLRERLSKILEQQVSIGTVLLFALTHVLTLIVGIILNKYLSRGD